MLCTRACCNSLHRLSHLILTTTLQAGVLVTPILQVRKQWHLAYSYAFSRPQFECLFLGEGSNTLTSLSLHFSLFLAVCSFVPLPEDCELC